MAGKSFSYNFIINGAVNNSLISSFGRVNRLTQTMSIQNIDLKNSIAQINNAFRLGTVSSATYAARMKELSSAQRAIASTALKSSSSSLFFSAANLQNTVGTIRSIAAPIESAVKTAMSFEAAMSKVKAITMADNEETKQLTDTARELGEKTQYTASQAAEAMSFLGMAGWKTNQIIAGMPGLLNLAAAGGTDLAKTADIVSDDLTAFGLDAEAAGHMADVYAVAITKTNTNVEMLGETMKYAAPVAHAFGVSMEETAALAGLMANSGIKASNAGTALRSGFLRLAGPPKMAANALAQLGMTAQDLTAEQKEAAIAMESLGIKTGDTTGPQKMVSILTQLRERMQGLSQEEQLATAKAIFGTEAASGWLAVLNSAPGTFENLLQDIQKSDGAAAKIAATMKDNGVGAAEKFKSAQESLAISVGNIFLPQLTRAMNGLAGYTGSLSQSAQQHPVLIGGIAAMGGAIAMTVTALQAVGVAYQGVIAIKAAYTAITTSSMFATIAHTASTVAGTVSLTGRAIALAALNGITGLWTGITNLATAAQWALNTAMLACPIGWVITGIGLLIGAGILLYNNWDTVKSFFITLWDSPMTALNNFCSSVQNIFGDIVQWVTGKWGELRQTLSHPIDALINYNQSIGSAPDVAANAAGGIYNRGSFLTTFAEDSPEAAIPIDGSRRALGLWQETGRRLGALNASGIAPQKSGTRSTTINFAPQITIQGNADKSTMESAMKDAVSDLRRMLKDIQRDERRLSYG